MNFKQKTVLIDHRISKIGTMEPNLFLFIRERIHLNQKSKSNGLSNDAFNENIQ